MKCNFVESDDVAVPFSQIPCGEPFRLLGNNTPQLRIRATAHNAVNLITGACHQVERDTPVVLLDAELTVSI